MAVNNCSPGNGALAVSMIKLRRSSTVRDTLEVYPYETDKLKRPQRFIPNSTNVFHIKKKKRNKNNLIHSN